jgi:hypothetical protein
MLVKWLDQPMQVYRTGLGYLGANAKAATRTPPAHPEGYLEAFANIYKNFANHIRTLGFDVSIAPNTPVGEYSLALRSASGERRFVIGGISVENYPNFWSVANFK